MRPSFLQRLDDSSIRHVLIAGCGGGFDFVHGLLLVPELRRMGKRITIVSYSFGDVEQYEGDVVSFFEEPPAAVRRVNARTGHAEAYAPEVHVCSYLDARFPAEAPHAVYACYSRAFVVGSLLRFYRRLAAERGIDAVLLVDGGSDSLVVGDEPGLGDPVEDAVSVQAVAALDEVPLRLLVSVGLGVDRHNGVSDVASLRAVAELSRDGGFLGALALERDSEGFEFYRRGLEHVATRQSFRSVVAGAILGAVEGRFGHEEVPPYLDGRLAPGSLFLWPLMGMLWAFDVGAVARRSRVGAWIRNASTPAENYDALRQGRRALSVREEPERFPDASPWPWSVVFDRRDGESPAP